MKICFCRIDNRLLHGQVTMAWTNKYKITQIFVVDDELYCDDISKKVLMLASPVGVNTTVYSTEQMAKVMEQDYILQQEEKVAILVRSVADAKHLFYRMGKFTDHLILGGCSSGIGRYKVQDHLYLNAEEQADIIEVAKKYGIGMEHQILPSDSPTNLVTLLKGQKWNKNEYRNIY